MILKGSSIYQLEKVLSPLHRKGVDVVSCLRAARPTEMGRGHSLIALQYTLMTCPFHSLFMSTIIHLPP